MALNGTGLAPSFLVVLLASVATLLLSLSSFVVCRRRMGPDSRLVRYNLFSLRFARLENCVCRAGRILRVVARVRATTERRCALNVGMGVVPHKWKHTHTHSRRASWADQNCQAL